VHGNLHSGKTSGAERSNKSWEFGSSPIALQPRRVDWRDKW